MHWTDIIQPSELTAPAIGRALLTVDQARRVLEWVGELTIPAALTWGTVLAFASRRDQALLADDDTRRWEWGPRLTFAGPSVRWEGYWTSGREVTLRARGQQVEMSWDSGTGRPSRLIGSLLAQVGATAMPPVSRETARQIRERLGVRC